MVLWQIRDMNFSDLKKRLLSALFLLIIAWAFLFAPFIFAFCFFIIATYYLLKEWWQSSAMGDGRTIFDFYICLYIVFGLASLIVLRLYPPIMPFLLGIVLVTIATDTGAYFCGRIFGGIKPFPLISPKKTLSGYIGGIIFGSLTSFILWSSDFMGIFMMVCLPLVVLAGDLLQSAFKRKHAIKDTGTILPGHGGLFDRFDGLLGACSFFVLSFFSIDFFKQIIL